MNYQTCLWLLILVCFQYLLHNTQRYIAKHQRPSREMKLKRFMKYNVFFYCEFYSQIYKILEISQLRDTKQNTLKKANVAFKSLNWTYCAFPSKQDWLDSEHLGSASFIRYIRDCFKLIPDEWLPFIFFSLYPAQWQRILPIGIFRCCMFATASPKRTANRELNNFNLGNGTFLWSKGANFVLLVRRVT